MLNPKARDHDRRLYRCPRHVRTSRRGACHAARLHRRCRKRYPRAPGPPGVHGAADGQWPGRNSQHCVIFVVDIAGFAAASAGDDEVQLAVRDALYGLLIRAFSASAITWEQCFHEDRGDGALVIIPARH